MPNLFIPSGNGTRKSTGESRFEKWLTAVKLDERFADVTTLGCFEMGFVKTRTCSPLHGRKTERKVLSFGLMSLLSSCLVFFVLSVLNFDEKERNKFVCLEKVQIVLHPFFLGFIFLFIL